MGPLRGHDFQHLKLNNLLTSEMQSTHPKCLNKKQLLNVLDMSSGYLGFMQMTRFAQSCRYGNQAKSVKWTNSE